MSSIPRLSDQGSPISLLGQILAQHPELPAATYQVDSTYPGLLEITTHASQPFANFETWRTTLFLGTPTVHHYEGSSWVAVKGRVADVDVALSGHALTAEIETYVAGLLAVAKPAPARPSVPQQQDRRAA